MAKSTKCILVVDDEEDLTWSISKGLLRKQENFEVFCVNSGKEALDILRQQKIDVLVTDLRMPDLNGFGLIDVVNNRYPEVKVIVMTAYGSNDIYNKLKHSGIRGYIEKPFEINDLRQMIQSQLIADNNLTEKRQALG